MSEPKKEEIQWLLTLCWVAIHNKVYRISEKAPHALVLRKKNVQALGGEFKAFYVVMGQYDFVAIIEAPDDETAAKLALATASEGNVRIETLRAFTEDEYGEIVASLP